MDTLLVADLSHIFCKKQQKIVGNNLNSLPTSAF